MAISRATNTDIPSLVSLINSAYRGDSSRKGWTTEADLIGGEIRTNSSSLHEVINKPGAVFFKHCDDEGRITGCVFVQKMERGLYLGMLSVSPELQAGGIGKKLLQAATQYAGANDCPVIYMSVISVRHELIAWYQRHGYQLTGETKPFPTDNEFGVPTQPIEFVIMEKVV